MKKAGIIILVLLVLGFFVLNVLNGLGTVNGKVDITHTDKTSWKIDYKFDQSVFGIMTGPITKEYHESSWVLPQEFHFVKGEDGYSWLEKKDRSSFNQLSVKVKTYDKTVFYAPQPFVVFDFGVSINTAPLGFATKVKVIGLFEMMHHFNLNYSFYGLDNESIIVPGTSNPVDVPINGQGYFVYFGDQSFVTETSTVQLILDEDFPVTLREEILPNAEKFTSFYNRELGEEVLDGKLMVQMNYSKTPRDGTNGFNIGGGAQNSQFSGLAKGPVDSTETEKLTKKIRAFMAHEMGHIWQPLLGADNMRWVSEGGAEILSHVAMTQLGMMTNEEFNTFLNKYIAESITALKEVSLENPHHYGHEQLNYSAGTIAIWSACKAVGGNTDNDIIFKMNRELGKFSRDSLNLHPKECLKALFTSLGMKEEAIEGINNFVNIKHDNPIEAYKVLFDNTGVNYQILGDSLIIKD
tara:strand:+ start:78 stop:1475 length:1398 start_codon:yes stop_codon:yes gene_type:complete